MLEFLQAGKFIGSDWWNLPPARAQPDDLRRKPGPAGDEVREDARNIHEALYKTLEGLTDEQLNDPAQWPGMPAEWMPWDVIAGNTYRHYRDHSADLKQFIAHMVR